MLAAPGAVLAQEAGGAGGGDDGIQTGSVGGFGKVQHGAAVESVVGDVFAPTVFVELQGRIAHR